MNKFYRDIIVFTYAGVVVGAMAYHHHGDIAALIGLGISGAIVGGFVGLSENEEKSNEMVKE